MNIAIIGCGYVGTAIARHWHQDNSHIVTATTTTKERVAELEEVAQRVVVMKGDDETALKAVIQNQDAVILCVAPIGDRQVDANVYSETYLPTAKNLVAALQQAPTVKQLIYTNSYSVYGNTNGAWVDEDTPVAPVNKRGEVLCETEQILLEGAKHSRHQPGMKSQILDENASPVQDLRVCILRLGGIYGPGRELVEMFSRFAGTTRPGDGEYFTNWVHLEDIVSVVDFVILNGLQGIYNLVNDVPVITRELVERGCERHGLPQVLWDASLPNLRPYSVRVSNQKIKAAGYRFIHPEILF
ncbi:MAG TPA: SDR family oxidoreductase [Candidatus Obscuribacterales bacterium]